MEYNAAVPVPLDWYLVLSGILFAIGMVGVLTRRNVLVIFMSVELMMNAVNISLVAFGSALNSRAGQVQFVNPGGGWTSTEIDAYKGQPRALGIELYTNFLMPFEIASFILLVAVVGAIVLARREHATSEEYSSIGITMGRNAAPPNSPQAIEQARTLMGVVPGIRVVRPLEGDPDAEVESPPEPVGAGNSTRGEESK